MNANSFGVAMSGVVSRVGLGLLIAVALAALGSPGFAQDGRTAQLIGAPRVVPALELSQDSGPHYAEDSWWQTSARELTMFVQLGPRFHSIGASSGKTAGFGASLAAGYWLAPSLALDLRGDLSSVVEDGVGALSAHEQYRLGAGARLALPIALSPVVTAHLLYERLESEWALSQGAELSSRTQRDALVLDAGAGLCFGYGMLTGDLLFTAAFNVAGASESSSSLDAVAQFESAQTLQPGFMGMTSAGIEAHVGMRF